MTFRKVFEEESTCSAPKINGDFYSKRQREKVLTLMQGILFSSILPFPGKKSFWIALNKKVPGFQTQFCCLPISILYHSLLRLKRFCSRSETSSGRPFLDFGASKSQNMTIDDSELNRICRSLDFEAVYCCERADWAINIFLLT